MREGELRIVDGGTAGKHATGISTSFVETEREIRYETRDKFRFVNNPSPIRIVRSSLLPRFLKILFSAVGRENPGKLSEEGEKDAGVQIVILIVEPAGWK